MNTLDVLDYLCSAGRQRMLQFMIARGCIAATYVGLEVCRYFGVRAEPVATSLVVCNRAMIEWMSEKDRRPISEALDAGAWSLAVQGTGVIDRDESSWDGHLVFIAEGRLVDLSADQLTREHKDIRLRSLHVPFESFPASYVDDDETCVLRYERMPEQLQRSYRASPDWNDRRWRALVGELIRDLRGRDDTSERSAHSCAL